MSEPLTSWSQYYANVTGRQPRPGFLKALSLFPPSDAPRQAIDLGCGDGTETLHLLAQGWQVLAIDAEPEALRLLDARVPDPLRPSLQTQQASFEQATLIPADFITANVSLPFCHPQRFEAVWARILAALKPGGRLSVDLFGVRDGWANNPGMTFHDVDSTRALFDSLTIESFEEIEDDQPTAGGTPKHWHEFKVIAIQPA